jgi:hypothetical protein
VPITYIRPGVYVEEVPTPCQASRARKCPGVCVRAAAWMPPVNENTNTRKETRHPWAAAHGSPIRTHATSGHLRRAGHGSARVPRQGRRHNAKTPQNVIDRNTRGLPPTARLFAHTPPLATTGEPGTEVPGCRGMDAATTQKHHKTQSIVDLSSSHFDVPEGTRLVTRFATFPVVSFFRQLQNVAGETPSHSQNSFTVSCNCANPQAAALIQDT